MAGNLIAKENHITMFFKGVFSNASDLDDYVHNIKPEKNEWTAALFHDNSQSLEKATFHINQLENIIEEIQYAGCELKDSRVIEGLKQYYNEGRKALVDVGVALRSETENDNNKGLHSFFLGPLNDERRVNQALYVEVKHNNERITNMPNIKVETAKGEALNVIGEFMHAKRHLTQRNQFQMIEHLKNSVCAAHQGASRNAENFESVLKLPRFAGIETVTHP